MSSVAYSKACCGLGLPDVSAQQSKRSMGAAFCGHQPPFPPGSHQCSICAQQPLRSSPPLTSDDCSPAIFQRTLLDDADLLSNGARSDGVVACSEAAGLASEVPAVGYITAAHTWADITIRAGEQEMQQMDHISAQCSDPQHAPASSAAQQASQGLTSIGHEP